MAHNASEPDFVVPAYSIPAYWSRVCAVHMDRKMVAAVWGAVGEGDSVVLYGEYLAKRGDLAIHADAIRRRGGWIPAVLDPDADRRKKAEGQRLVDRFVDLNVNLFVVEGDQEAGLHEMATRLSSKRFRVLDTMTEWLTQYRGYRRNSDGEVLEGDHQLMTATELLVWGLVAHVVADWLLQND